MSDYYFLSALREALHVLKRGGSVESDIRQLKLLMKQGSKGIIYPLLNDMYMVPEEFRRYNSYWHRCYDLLYTLIAEGVSEVYSIRLCIERGEFRILEDLLRNYEGNTFNISSCRVENMRAVVEIFSGFGINAYMVYYDRVVSPVEYFFLLYSDRTYGKASSRIFIQSVAKMCPPPDRERLLEIVAQQSPHVDLQKMEEMFELFNE